MGGSLINLISYGANDLFLTGSPEITLFKMVYRRHTNFAKESISIPLSDIDFGKEVQIEIPKVGDLISTTYIQINIPNVHLLKTDTASDLSNAQYNVLTSPYYVNVPENMPNYVTQYEQIKNYMSVNMVGYRKALDAQNIKNQTVLQYINSILDAIQASAVEPEILQKYELILNEAFTYEINKLEKNNEQITSYKLELQTETEQKNIDFYNQQINLLTTQNAIILKNVSILDYRFSDITYILNTLVDSFSSSGILVYGFIDVNQITVENVLTLINKAVDVSKQVVEYYFTNVKLINEEKALSESKYAKFAWVEKLGHAIIDYVEVRIGGEVIDKHYGEWINIWSELTNTGDQEIIYNKMIGNVNEMTTFDRNEKPAYVLYVPLSFWFCKKHGLAFPLIALQYNKFFITVKLRNLEDCAYVEKLPTVDQNGNPVDFTNNALQLTDIWSNLSNNGLSISGNLLMDYVFLESNERARFAQYGHEYLIETVEVTALQNLTDTTRVVELNFTGPSKEMIWVTQKTKYINNETSNYNSLWFNYSTDKNKLLNPIINVDLSFNGYDRFSKMVGFGSRNYYNLVQPYQHHTSSPSNGINCYSFALKPEEHQPSGTCNFTRIKFPLMTFTFDPEMFQYKLSDIDPDIVPNSENDIIITTEINLSIYSIKYNILRVMQGMACLAYY
jgi:hypothetical protein